MTASGEERVLEGGGPELFDEWLRNALIELEQARVAFLARNGQAGVVGAKRAAGMALHGALLGHPRGDWGRTYLDHLAVLGEDLGAPEGVREAALLLVRERRGGGTLITLGSRAQDERILEAARTVMAHAYALAYGSTGRQSPDCPSEGSQ